MQRAASGLTIDRDALALEPLSLQRRVLLQALRDAGAVQPGFAEVERLRELVNGDVSSVEVGGRIRAERIAAKRGLSK